MSPEKAFGEIVREFRKGQAMSQETLAASSGLDRSFISHIECGVKSPTLKSIFQIAQALGIPVSEMMFLVEGRIKICKG